MPSTTSSRFPATGTPGPGLAGTLALGLALAWPMSSGLAEPQTRRPIQDTVTVGVLTEWPPHFHVGSGGRPGGFAVDMMEAVARRTGLAVRYEPYTSFSDAIEALRVGAVDVLPDLGIIPSRTEEFAFTNPFEAFRIALFVRATDPAIRSPADLAGRRVATVVTNVGVSLVPERYPDADMVVEGDVSAALFDLLAARVDAAIYPEEVFFGLARSVGLENRIRVVPPPLDEVRRGMAVRRADTTLLATLDRGIDDLVGSPEYEEIYQRWFTPSVGFWTVRRVAWSSAAVLLVVLLVMGVWRFRSVSRLARDLSRTLRERDAAREMSRRDEERFELVVKTASEGIVMSDEKDRVVFVNPRACELLGVAEDEILGRPVSEVLDEEIHHRIRGGASRRREGVTDRYEITPTRPDGRQVSLLISAVPIPGTHATIQGAFATLTDITDRVRAETALRERERRLAAFVENASELISTLDADGRMQYQSPPLTRLLGWVPGDLEGQSAFDYVHPEDVDTARAAWEEMLSVPGEPVRLGLFRFRHKDGSWRTLSAAITNLLDDPAVRGVLSNAQDVTTRYELERQLAQSQKLEAIGRLAGGIAHDFNNLLTVISAQTGLLLMELAGDKRLSREVGLIQTTADRAAALTRQLLAFSRDQILQPRVVSLREVVRKMAGLLDRIIGEDVDIEIDVPDGLPSVELDPVQLEQVILNLAVNARDAMPGGGTLTLSARREDLDRLRADDLGGIKPGVYTVLEVSDTGAGMDEETLARAFEPFFTTKARGKGTGLGLSGAYGFVTQTGGSIRVDSDVGRGTTFVLRFPAVEGAPLPVAGTPTRGAEIPARDRGAVILVVEDTEEVREAARKILERSEFVVEVARTAEAGLEVLEKRDDIGLVLTDLVLPGMSGRALVERLRASRPDLPVLVMSGYADDSPGHPGDLPPDIPFLPKPFAVGTLLRAIAEAMGADGSGP